MNDDQDFRFGDGRGTGDDGAVRVFVPKATKTALDLMRIIARGLRFPAYFGESWNALFDCLCDLGWLEERQVIIVHEGIPEIPAEHLREYLRVLRDAVGSWEGDSEQHELLVYFPLGAKLPE